MTNLEIIIIIILWIAFGIFAIFKLLQFDSITFKELLDFDIIGTLLFILLTIVVNPFIWVGAIIYFTFINPGKNN